MKRSCIVGWPLSHSRSPLVHGYWLERYRIDGRYDRRAIPPWRIGRFFASFLSEGLIGANITAPYKEHAARLAAIDDPAIRKLGSVNTLYVENRRVKGTSTDGGGFLAGLAQDVPHWRARGSNGVILGAGGAARSIAGALIRAGADRVTLVNRTEARARNVAEILGPVARYAGWCKRDDVLGDADLLVNATVLGMAGKPALDLRLDRLAPRAVVADIVYMPLVTPLLAQARARGHAVSDGLSMLLHQAVGGFELWFGIRPRVDDSLRALAIKDMLGG
ncbi:MAG: shikimate dehydrogenase [Hyphomicrobiales bacterium]